LIPQTSPQPTGGGPDARASRAGRPGATATRGVGQLLARSSASGWSAGLALLLLLLGGVGCSDPAPPPAPNVVLLVIDTLRADHLHGYGYPRETSPHLDAIMRQGVRFDAAIAPSSWSAPSHATIVTGMQPESHHVLGWHQRVAPGVETLAAILQREGYATGMFSAHYALHVGVPGLKAGLDTAFIARNDDDAQVLDEAKQWVRSAGQPYFLYVCLMTPHAPYTKYPLSYDQDYFTGEPPGGDATFEFTDESWIGRGGIPRSVRLGDHRNRAYYVNRYDRAIRYADALLADFWGSLATDGLLDDTIVVVTSDHGEGLGDRGSFAHEYHLYDFLVRVPLVISQPGAVPAGGSWAPPVSLADIVPTILGLAGVAPPAPLDGRDLSGWLTSGTRPVNSPVVTGTYRWRGHDRYMVRSARHKLIYDADEDREELYDLARDPAEERELIAPEPSAAVLAALRAELASLRARHAALDPERVDAPPDADLLEKLRSLGYVRDESD